jgi:FkbM family methyltransferase
MGQQLALHPDTAIPCCRWNRLLREAPPARIVAFADLVQMQSVCRLLYEEKWAGESPVVVEVGAFHGVYAVLFGKLVAPHGGCVIAVEPDPANLAILRSNVRRNGLENVVRIEPVAISSHSGKATFSVAGSEGHLVAKVVAGEPTVPVQTAPLSDLLSRHEVTHVDLLVVDVEGAELAVLRTFPWDTIPCRRVFCELHPYNWPHFGTTPGDMLAFLNSRQWRCLDMYLRDLRDFHDPAYIGPCLLLPPDAPKRHLL